MYTEARSSGGARRRTPADTADPFGGTDSGPPSLTFAPVPSVTMLLLSSAVTPPPPQVVVTTASLVVTKAPVVPTT
ncbi:hypothetical protein [Mycobacterium lepromatosis]|uniref:hypothetical protein n=1 Tax=Mycobacterium lepromatosis TaxID=480418 RepID=UPI000679B937|nr:hypothetical protein [Mycobacterium lepromatosis]